MERTGSQLEHSGGGREHTAATSLWTNTSARWKGSAKKESELDAVWNEVTSMQQPAAPSSGTRRKRDVKEESWYKKQQEDVDVGRLRLQDGELWATLMFHSCTLTHILTGINAGPVSCSTTHQTVSTLLTLQQQHSCRFTHVKKSKHHHLVTIEPRHWDLFISFYWTQTFLPVYLNLFTYLFMYLFIDGWCAVQFLCVYTMNYYCTYCWAPVVYCLFSIFTNSSYKTITKILYLYIISYIIWEHVTNSSAV